MDGHQRLRHQLVELVRFAAKGQRRRLPPAGGLLWGVFAELGETRSYHASGPNPISYQEIEAYCRLTHTPLEPHHVAIIRAMDAAWIVEVVQDKATPPTGPKLTAAAFDAVFS